MSFRDTVLRLATAVNPELNDTLRFAHFYGRLPNRRDPKTFAEKLLVLKDSYRDDPLVIQCADKLRVRDYVESRGCGEYLNELYAAYDLGEQIGWDVLPESFAMKLNTGAGCNYFCESKSDEFSELISTLDAWQNIGHGWLESAETQYEKIQPMVLFEKLLDIHRSGDVEDYKLYCFDGEPKAILLMSDRFSGNGIKDLFVTPTWEPLGPPENNPDVRTFSCLPPAPTCLSEMLDAGSRLSRGWPFVRVDFYVVDGNPVFGEMTFTPSGCIGASEVSIDGRPLGDLVDLGYLSKGGRPSWA